MSIVQIIRVALIDDHDLLRGELCKCLESFGFQTIFEAENGKVALAKMEKCDIMPDVCILDVNMPVMNGIETAKFIKEKYPMIKILGFSINDDESDVSRMLQSGIDGYILKGADPDELKAALHVLYNGGRYFSPGVKEMAEQYFRDVH